MRNPEGGGSKRIIVIGYWRTRRYRSHLDNFIDSGFEGIGVSCCGREIMGEEHVAFDLKLQVRRISGEKGVRAFETPEC